MPGDRESPFGSVAAIWRYPVKSMLGEQLRSVVVAGYGLVGDRAYALIDRSDGKVATAKNPRKWPGLFAFRARLLESAGGSRRPSVHITLPSGHVVYGDQDDVELELSAALGRDVTLEAMEDAPAALRKPPAASGADLLSEIAGATSADLDTAEPTPNASGGSSRYTSESYWPQIEGLDIPESVTDFRLRPRTFFDSAPIHLLTTATLERFREIYPAGRFDSRRFRPNLVIESGGSGFVESAWIGRTLAVGDEVLLAVTGPTERCVMTTLAQDDLPADSGILRAAVQHNRAVVGVYATVERGGAIRHGDRVGVTAT